MTGTPKTLRQAIINGLISQANEPWGKTDDEVVEMHVLDFLRQRFGTTYLEVENDLSAPTARVTLLVLKKLAKDIGVEK